MNRSLDATRRRLARAWLAAAACALPRVVFATDPAAPLAAHAGANAPLAPPAARPAPRVGGHFGVALPLVSFASDGVTAIGADFVQVGVVPGVNVRLDDHWSIDFEFIGFSRWELATNRAPARARTIFVVDPGVVYNFGPLSVGLRAAVQIGETVPFNLGLVPIVNKGFSLGAVNWYVELDLPVFVYGTPQQGASASFGPLVQTGISF